MSFGSADFLGGRASRTAPTLTVLFVGQVVAVVGALGDRARGRCRRRGPRPRVRRGGRCVQRRRARPALPRPRLGAHERGRAGDRGRGGDRADRVGRACTTNGRPPSRGSAPRSQSVPARSSRASPTRPVRGATDRVRSSSPSRPVSRSVRRSSSIPRRATSRASGRCSPRAPRPSSSWVSAWLVVGAAEPAPVADRPRGAGSRSAPACST